MLALLVPLAMVSVIDASLAVIAVRHIVPLFPERLNLVRNREESLFFTLRSKGGKGSHLISGLELPPGLGSSLTEVRGALPEEGMTLQVSLPVTGLVRGRYAIGPWHCRMISPLGLWGGQRRFSVPTVVHVYPDLLQARKRLAALFANRQEVPIHARRQVGQGREFEKLRTYLPGDSIGDIHWKATARKSYPVTKQYQIERTQEVYVVVDASRLSSRTVPAGNGEADDTLLEHYVTAALLLGMAAQRQGDLFGLLTFSDRIHSFVRAGAGRTHFGTCRDALHTLQPRLVTPDFEEMATFLGLRVRKRALFLVLTSLDEPGLAEDFITCVNALNRRHLVVASMLRPLAARPLFSEQVSAVEEIYRDLAGHMIWNRLKELKEVLGRRGVDFVQLEHGRLAADLVSRYVDIKRRQVL